MPVNASAAFAHDVLVYAPLEVQHGMPATWHPAQMFTCMEAIH